MELEDEEVKDFIQRQRSQWKEIARHPERVDIVLQRTLDHFLEHPDPNGFKAQLVAVSRLATIRYFDALQEARAELVAQLEALGPEMLDLAVERTDAGRPVEFVAGKGIEIDVQILHIDGHVGRALAAVDQYQGTIVMRQRRHLLDRHDGAEHVRDMGDGDQFCPFAQQCATPRSG